MYRNLITFIASTANRWQKLKKKTTKGITTVLQHETNFLKHTVSNNPFYQHEVNTRKVTRSPRDLFTPRRRTRSNLSTHTLSYNKHALIFRKSFRSTESRRQ